MDFYDKGGSELEFGSGGEPVMLPPTVKNLSKLPVATPITPQSSEHESYTVRSSHESESPKYLQVLTDKQVAKYAHRYTRGIGEQKGKG